MLARTSGESDPPAHFATTSEASAPELGRDGEFPVDSRSFGVHNSVFPGGVWGETAAPAALDGLIEPWDAAGTSPALDTAATDPLAPQGRLLATHNSGGDDLTRLPSTKLADSPSTGSFSMVSAGEKTTSFAQTFSGAVAAKVETFAHGNKVPMMSFATPIKTGEGPTPVASGKSRAAPHSMAAVTFAMGSAEKQLGLNESKDPRACSIVLLSQGHSFCLGKVGNKGKFCLKEAEACSVASHSTKLDVSLGCYYLLNEQFQGLAGPVFDSFEFDGDSLFEHFKGGRFVPETWDQIKQMVEGNRANPGAEIEAEEATAILEKPLPLPTPAKKKRRLEALLLPQYTVDNISTSLSSDLKEAFSTVESMTEDMHLHLRAIYRLVGAPSDEEDGAVAVFSSVG